MDFVNTYTWYTYTFWILTVFTVFSINHNDRIIELIIHDYTQYRLHTTHTWRRYTTFACYVITHTLRRKSLSLKVIIRLLDFVSLFCQIVRFPVNRSITIYSDFEQFYNRNLSGFRIAHFKCIFPVSAVRRIYYNRPSSCNIFTLDCRWARFYVWDFQAAEEVVLTSYVHCLFR